MPQNNVPEFLQFMTPCSLGGISATLGPATLQIIYLENATEGNTEFMVVEIGRLEASTPLSQPSHSDDYILQKIFAVDCPNPILHHFDLHVKKIHRTVNYNYL